MPAQAQRKNLPGRRFFTKDGGSGLTAVYDAERNLTVAYYERSKDAKVEAKRLNALDRAGKVDL